MKIKLLLALLLICGQLTAQMSVDEASTTRALIIGISDYQEARIPDLRFADRDAQAFATFLQSPAGGSLPSDQITLMTNKEATTGAIAAAMDWLIADSQKGDKVIIYFSGHGDVETRTKFQRGFLLTYDSPPSNYLAGAFALIFLQDIISTLSDQGVQVIMISDACRAGKLAGSEIGGAQATAANLAKQFANEIKILSCQPDEFSLEGEQWGGGRGAFSYHLIDGLTGMADGNGDLQVNLFEAGRYLEDRVPTETAPQTQIPMTVGKRSTIISMVDEASLAEVKARKAQESPSLSAIDTRGFDEVIIEQLDSIAREKYQRFVAALEKGLLLEPKGENAYDLYQELSKVAALGRLKGVMLRNLAAKLQEESQQAINAYLRADDEELSARARGEIRYKKFVDYLEKAAELLGPDHYMYKSLKAKQHYFHSVDTRVRFSGRTFSLGDSAIVWQEWCEESMKKALEYEQNAAYLYNEMSLLSRGESRLNYLKKAMSMAPNWVVPCSNMISYHNSEKDYKKAEAYFNKGIAIDPDYSYLYVNIGNTYWQQKKYERSKAMRLKAVELSPDNPNHVIAVGNYYADTKDFKKAEQYWLQALKISPKHINLYNKLHNFYYQNKQYDKSEAITLKRLEVRPTDGDGHCDLISIYVKTGQMEKIKSLMKKMEEINKTTPNWEGKTCFGYAYRELGEYDLAIKYALEAVSNAPENPWNYQVLATTYRNIGQQDKFIDYVDTMIMKGVSIPFIEGRFNFESANQAPNFKAFAQKMIDQGPKHGLGYRLLGNYYDGQLDFKTASQWYKKAVQLSPEDWVSRYNHARSNYLSGQLKKAESLFSKLIKIFGETPGTFGALGYFYAMHSDNELAKKYLNKTIELDSTNRNAYRNLAWVLYTENQNQAAYELLDKAIGQMESPSFKANLQIFKAGLYLYEGNDEQALDWAKRAANLLEEYRIIIPFLEKLVVDDKPGAANYLEILLQKFPGTESLQYILCRTKAELGEEAVALDYLEKALVSLQHPYAFIQNDPKLASLRKTARYKEIMRRHFPEKFKGF